jgi:hypothetical protein
MPQGLFQGLAMRVSRPLPTLAASTPCSDSQSDFMTASHAMGGITLPATLTGGLERLGSGAMLFSPHHSE